MSKYTTACASLRPGQLDKLIAKIKDKKPMYEIFIDTETTGVIPTLNGLWQVSFTIYSGSTPLEKFSSNINVFPKDKIDPKALEVGGVTVEELQSFPAPELIYHDIKTIFEKYVNKFNPKDKLLMYAYNARFDYDFLRAWWNKNGDKYFGSYIHFPPIDIMNLAAHKLRFEREALKDFKLGTVAQHLGIEVAKGELHDAQYDIELAREVYLKVTK